MDFRQKVFDIFDSYDLLIPTHIINEIVAAHEEVNTANERRLERRPYRRPDPEGEYPQGETWKGQGSMP